MGLKLTNDFISLFLIEDSKVYSMGVQHVGREAYQDAEKFSVEVSDGPSSLCSKIVLISSDVYLEKLNGFNKRLPKRPLGGQESLMIAGRASYRFLGLNNTNNEPYFVSTYTIDSLFDFDSSNEEADDKLQRLILTFFKSRPNDAITVEDLFISTNYDTDTILSRIAYLKKRGILRPLFTEKLSSDEMEKILESEEGKRIGTLNEWGGEAGYLLTEDGFEKLERLILNTKPVENRYFHVVKIPELEGKKFAFVLMPFKEEDFPQAIYKEIIKTTVEKERSCLCVRSDEITEPGRLNNQIYTGIYNADIVLAEMTNENLNVAIEVGIALTLNKPVYIFTQKDPPKLFFDIKDLRMIKYNDGEDLKVKLASALRPKI